VLRLLVKYGEQTKLRDLSANKNTSTVLLQALKIVAAKCTMIVCVDKLNNANDEVVGI